MYKYTVYTHIYVYLCVYIYTYNTMYSMYMCVRIYVYKYVCRYAVEVMQVFCLVQNNANGFFSVPFVTVNLWRRIISMNDSLSRNVTLLWTPVRMFIMFTITHVTFMCDIGSTIITCFIRISIINIYM